MSSFFVRLSVSVSGGAIVVEPKRGMHRAVVTTVKADKGAIAAAATNATSSNLVMEELDNIII